MISYLIFVLIDALVIWIVHPGIDTYGNALWHCCATIAIRQKETPEALMHKLKHLPELSREELEELSANVRRFAKKRRGERDD